MKVLRWIKKWYLKAFEGCDVNVIIFCFRRLNYILYERAKKISSNFKYEFIFLKYAMLVLRKFARHHASFYGIFFCVWCVGCPRNNQIFFLGSNRNKPKHNLFRFIFGLFRETKKLFFRSVSVFRSVSKQPKQTDLFRNKPKKKQKPNKNSPSNCTRKALTGPTSLDAKPRV
jgi:hypothetical protein